MADEAACTEGESISESWHGVDAREVNAGVEEAPESEADSGRKNV